GVEKDREAVLLEAIQIGLVESAEDFSEGCLAVCLAESVIRSENLGTTIELSGNETEQLFSETQSRFVVTVNENNQKDFENIFEDAKVIGKVVNEATLQINVNDALIINEEVSTLKQLWSNSIADLFEYK